MKGSVSRYIERERMRFIFRRGEVGHMAAASEN